MKVDIYSTGKIRTKKQEIAAARRSQACWRPPAPVHGDSHRGRSDAVEEPSFRRSASTRRTAHLAQGFLFRVAAGARSLSCKEKRGYVKDKIISFLLYE
jgi:hypothetical protein